jgi:hypothetical protein
VNLSIGTFGAVRLRVDLPGNGTLPNAMFTDDQNRAVALGDAENSALSLRLDRGRRVHEGKRLGLPLHGLYVRTAWNERSLAHTPSLAMRVPNKGMVRGMGFPWAISASWDSSRVGRFPERRKSFSLSVERIVASEFVQSGNSFPLSAARGPDSGRFTGDALRQSRSPFGNRIAKEDATD